MTKTIERYQSLFLRERNENKGTDKNGRDGNGLEYRLESAPYYSKFMQRHQSRPISSQNYKSILSDYETILTEKKVHHPININEQMVGIVRALVGGNISEKDTAHLLFQWIVDTISYDYVKKRLIDMSDGKPVPYRSAVQTFQERKGVCGEMANLNIAMARIALMKSNYASVSQLEDGSRAVHACAAVYVNGKVILSDPAMKKFDIQHRQYEIIPDTEMEHKMRVWNNGTA